MIIWFYIGYSLKIKDGILSFDIKIPKKKRDSYSINTYIYGS